MVELGRINLNYKNISREGLKNVNRRNRLVNVIYMIHFVPA